MEGSEMRNMPAKNQSSEPGFAVWSVVESVPGR